MRGIPIESQNYFLACYAASLVQGESITGIAIRSRTVTNYITAVCELFTEQHLPSPRLSTIDYISVITNALKNYEQVDNRRVMITDAMTQWMYTFVQKLPPDAPERAIFDWILLGRYAGFRPVEWCQHTQTEFRRIEEWPGRPPYGFIPSDFSFLGTNERLFTQDDLMRIELVESLRLKFRKQKNKDNGQVIPFKCDLVNPHLCPVRAAFRIFLRHKRLHGSPDEPLAICRNATNTKTIFITDNLTTKFLRKAAMAVHNISPNSSALAQWSSHSIRVTAANLLHRANLSDSFIQLRLRWKSTAFLRYLRHTFNAADSHTKALGISDNNLPPLAARSYRPLEPHETLHLAPAA
jgi:hypothetical protein